MGFKKFFISLLLILPGVLFAQENSIFLSVEASLLNSYERGNLDTYWQYITGDPNALPDSGSPAFLGFTLGYFRHIANGAVGAEIQYIPTNEKAIWGTHLVFGGRDEIYFRANIISILLSIRGNINEDGSLQYAIKPGMSIATNSGKLISGSQTLLDFTAGSGLGGVLVAGINFYPIDMVNISINAGYRFLKTDAIYEDPASSTGYSQPYVDQQNDELLKIDWSGLYASLGIGLNLGL